MITSKTSWENGLFTNLHFHIENGISLIYIYIYNISYMLCVCIYIIYSICVIFMYVIYIVYMKNDALNI